MQFPFWILVIANTVSMGGGPEHITSVDRFQTEAECKAVMMTLLKRGSIRTDKFNVMPQRQNMTCLEVAADDAE